METRMTKRLQKDLEQMQKNHADTFQVRLVNNDIKHWIVGLKGAPGTVYEGEQFELQFKFSPDYPIESPEVIFIGKPPEHEHIYSNGFICLSILFDEWSAALTVSSVCLSILSMLSSAPKKSKPANDKEFIKRAAGRGPKSFLWSFDDDKTVELQTNQPGVVDTSQKRIISQSYQSYSSPVQQVVQQPVVTRKITRRLVPLDEGGGEVVQPQTPQQSMYVPPPQPVVHPVQQMIWPVAVQFNEDDALTKIREEKILGLLERQSEMLTNMLQKYKRIEEDQSYKLRKRIKELERENEEIWQKRRQNYMIFNVAQQVDQKLKEFNEFQLKPWIDQGQPILLRPMHQDDKEFLDPPKTNKRKKKKKKRRVYVPDPEDDDGNYQEPGDSNLQE